MKEVFVLINETDNIFKKIYEKNIDFHRFYNQIDIIGKKISNNKIGYFQFKADNTYYKIYVMPKIFNESREKFVDYISKYFQLLKMYPNISKHYIENNILDIAIKRKENNNLAYLDGFLEYKYLNALNNIKIFLKKYKSYASKEVGFVSQSIKYKIDFKKNIAELDKTKVHQLKKEQFSYSTIANITLKVLDHYLKYTIKHIYNNHEIKIQCLKIRNMIIKKFKVDDFNFKVDNLVLNNVKNHFRKREQKILYNSLLTLIGMEGYFNDKDNQIMNNKVENMVSIAFEANNVFEYFVYDKLIKKYDKDNVFFIKNNRVDLIKYSYLIESHNNHEEEVLSKRKSEPDFLVKINEKEILFDAKWKELNSFNDIETNDISKLYRDCKLRNINKGVLIYPKINFKMYEEKKYKLDYYNDFYFEIMECEVI